MSGLRYIRMQSNLCSDLGETRNTRHSDCRMERAESLGPAFEQGSRLDKRGSGPLSFQRYEEATCESADLPRGCAGINETRLKTGFRSMGVLVVVSSYLDVYSNKSTVCGHSPRIGTQHSASPPLHGHRGRAFQECSRKWSKFHTD